MGIIFNHALWLANSFDFAFGIIAKVSSLGMRGVEMVKINALNDNKDDDFYELQNGENDDGDGLLLHFFLIYWNQNILKRISQLHGYIDTSQR